MTAMAGFEEIKFYVILSTILYVDRYTQGNVVFFDGNSILLSIFFAHLFQHVRGTGVDVSFHVVLVYFIWGAIAALNLVDIFGVTHKNGIYSNLLLYFKKILFVDITSTQVFITASIIVFLSFHPTPVEPWGYITSKTFLFTIITTLWIYLVHMRTTHFNATYHTHYLVRFLPILILPFWMSMVFSLACIGIIIWQYKDELLMSQNSAIQHTYTTTELADTSTPPTTTQNNTDITIKPKSIVHIDSPRTAESNDTDIMAAFHLAKQAASKQNNV
jgi:hypothetical protein